MTPQTPRDLNAHWFELWNERAGIKEFCGNIPREQAEREAWVEIRKLMEERRGNDD